MKKQKSIGHQRLAKLASFLYRVPRERFNMRRWKIGKGKLTLNRRNCNSAGCAIGWATILFAEEGFELKYNFGFEVPHYKLSTTFSAVSEFFDIGFADSKSLFANTDETANLGPRQVAKRIKHFLRTGKVSKA